MNSLTVVKSGGVSKSPTKTSPTKKSPTKMMSDVDDAVSSLFDQVCPRLEALLEGVSAAAEVSRAAAEQTHLHARLAEQRTMLASYAGHLRAHSAVYEVGGGVCKSFAGGCQIAGPGRSGPLWATRCARVTVPLCYLATEYRNANDGIAPVFDRVAPGARQRLTRALVCPAVGEREPVISEFTRVKGVDPELQNWMPFAAVRVADRAYGAAHVDEVTFEIRLSRVCETVSGPRGMWWDELVALFVERLDFRPDCNNNRGRDLTIELDPPCLRSDRLWGPREE